MTRKQALDNALIQMENYLISRSYDEQLAKQQQEVRDGVRKWKSK